MEALVTRSRFTTELVDWLNRRLAPPGAVIAPETQLFADGMIDSLKVLELIAWTERAIGSTIPDPMIRMENFCSPERIAEIFVQPGGPDVDR